MSAPTRIDDFMLDLLPLDSPRFTVGSWREDAADDSDLPVTPTDRRPIELSPGVWIYPDFLDKLAKAKHDPYAPQWNFDNAA